MIKFIYRKMKQLYFTYLSAKKLRRNMRRLLPFCFALLFMFSVSLNGYCATQVEVYTQRELPQSKDGYSCCLLYTSTGVILLECTISLHAQDTTTLPNLTIGLFAQTGVNFKLVLCGLSSYFLNTISVRWTATKIGASGSYYDLQKLGGGVINYTFDTSDFPADYKDYNYVLLDETINLGRLWQCIPITGWTYVNLAGVGLESAFNIIVHWNESGDSAKLQENVDEIVNGELDDGGYSDDSKKQSDELGQLGEDIGTEKPDEDDVSQSVDDALDVNDSEYGFNILYNLANHRIVVIMITIVFGFAILGYVFFGKR